MSLRFLNKNNIVKGIIVSLLTLLVSSFAYSASTPEVISYQGFLTNSSGTAQSGTTTVTVRLYDASTGGTLLFEEVHPTTPVTNGYFTVQIGSVGDVNGSTSATSITNLTFDRAYYFTVELASPFSTGEMTLSGGTRSQLGTVPFATVAYGALQATSSALLTTGKGKLYFNTSDNQLYVYDGSAWNALGISGGGITSLNGLTGSSQSFALATSGTDIAITSTGTTHTLSIPDAGGSSRGVISTTTQTIAGDKTFTGTTTLTNLSATSATSTNFFTSILRALSATISTITGGSITATTSLTSQGTLAVTGQSTLNNASTSNLSTSNLYATGTASLASTTVGGTLSVTGATTLTNASTTGVSGTGLTFTNGFIGALTAT